MTMLISPEIKDLLEALSYLATLLGIPAAIIVFLVEKHRDRRLYELETHQYSNDLYIDYLGRCLDDPDSDAFEFRRDDKAVLESGVPYKRLIMFNIVISMMETAFLRYRYVHSAAQRTQWTGWRDYMAEWAERDDFRAAWPILGPQFDTDFVTQMNEIVANATPSTPNATNA